MEGECNLVEREKKGIGETCTIAVKPVLSLSFAILNITMVS
jgi:hypothetical protein